MDFWMERPAMKGLVIGGVVLALLGLLAFAIPVFTNQQTTDVARIGDLKLQTTETRSYVIPPFVAGGALLLGVLLIGAGFYQKR
jgi:protein-S-isoprenylcysteine O-methyltransferase Ste14